MKSYDVIKFLWRHNFFNNMNFNKSMLQILHLNALYPLAFVSLEKDVSCVSLYGFCGLITWLTKYGHDYRRHNQYNYCSRLACDITENCNSARIEGNANDLANTLVKNSLPSSEMSDWYSKYLLCSSATPVETLKPGDLDGGQSPEGKTENSKNGTTKNGGRCPVLSRIFNCKGKAEQTKKKKGNSDSPAVSSTDGAYCNPHK